VALSVFVWAMIGIALWHFTVIVPDRFWGGIIGAFLAALAGALLSRVLLPSPASEPPIHPALARPSGPSRAPSSPSSQATSTGRAGTMPRGIVRN
jgi:hypothetical protein